MAKFISIILVSISFIYAIEYDVYGVDGKVLGTLNCSTNTECIQFAFAKFTKAIVLVKKNDTIKIPKLLAANLISEDSLNVTLKDTAIWLETDKNKIQSICINDSNGIWNVNDFAYKIESKNCLQINTGNFVKSAMLRYVSKKIGTLNINVLVGMKYIDLSKTEHELGYFGTEFKYKTNNNTIYANNFQKTLDNMIFPDPVRMALINEKLLVDKYKVTDCEIVQTLWDSIPKKSRAQNQNIANYHDYWISKKLKFIKDEKCNIHDSAAIKVYLYHALVYANIRSKRDGLTPVYTFKHIKSDDFSPKLKENENFGTLSLGFFENFEGELSWIQVSVNKKADGYRLPYYNEWMALAKAKTVGKNYVWGNSKDKSFALQYAWFGENKILDINGVYVQDSRPVGMLKPNNYGLYDMAGIVCENVMLSKSIFDKEITSCKGGFLTDSLQNLNFGAHEDNVWGGFGGFQGLRLVRTIR